MGGAKTQYANAQHSQNKRLVSPIISSSSGRTEVVQSALRNRKFLQIVRSSELPRKEHN